MRRFCVALFVLVAVLSLVVPRIALAASASLSLPRGGSLMALLAVQQAELTTPGGAVGDGFGDSMAISGGTALVGAPQTSVNGQKSAGVVYIFTRSGTSWSEQAELSDVGGAADDDFGSSVALDGDTALVGAPFERVSVFNDQPGGAAYIYTRSGTTWSPQARLSNPDVADELDAFGTSVALDGDTAVVGAPYTTVDGQTKAGAAYIFTGSGESWSQPVKLIATNGAESDFFGQAVALSGATVLVGAPNASVDGKYEAGAAYIFTGSGTSWSLQAKLSDSKPAEWDRFGVSVALCGDTALLSVTDKTVDGKYGAGAAYIYTRSGTNWSQPAELTASDATADEVFGYSLALSGDTAVISATNQTVAGNSGAGAAYVFTRSQWLQESGVTISDTSTDWTQQAELTASDAAADNYFGSSVALSGGTLLVGASKPDGLIYVGTAYVFALGLDTTPPTTTVSGAESLWHNSDITLTLTATDNPSGFGVAATYFQIDGGAWTEGTSVTIPAPVDHSNDGIHTVSYYSTDNAGNTEATQSVTVKIDTRPPVIRLAYLSVYHHQRHPGGTWHRSSITRGHHASWPDWSRYGNRLSLTYRINDNLSPTVNITIELLGFRGKVLQTISLGQRPTGVLHVYRLPQKLARTDSLTCALQPPTWPATRRASWSASGRSRSSGHEGHRRSHRQRFSHD